MVIESNEKDTHDFFTKKGLKVPHWDIFGLVFFLAFLVYKVFLKVVSHALLYKHSLGIFKQTSSCWKLTATTGREVFFLKWIFSWFNRSVERRLQFWTAPKSALLFNHYSVYVLISLTDFTGVKPTQVIWPNKSGPIKSI